MKPRPFNTTNWLLALLLVSMPLIAGCWLGEERLTGNTPSGASAGVSQPIGDARGSASSPVANGNTSTIANKIQNIEIQGQPGIQFGGKRFKLVTTNELVNQYIPEDQRLDNWQVMFVVRRFPDLASPREAIDNVVDNLVQQGADQNLISVEPGRQPENEQAIDFIIWTEDKSLTEFNVHVYRKVRGGMIANMYLMRGYGTEGHNSLSLSVATNRQLILDSVLGSKFPLFVQ